jgi:hypothetical protein
MAGLGITAAFVAAHLVNDATADLQLFDLNEEQNLPTWWTAFLFTVAGLLALLLGLSERAQRPWIPLGVLMLALGLDDIARLHERMETAVGGTAGILVIESLLALGILLIFLSVSRIAGGRSRGLIVGALIALVLAQASSSLDFVHETISVPRPLLTVVEEGAEMTMGVFIVAAAIEPLLALLDRLLARRPS